MHGHTLEHFFAEEESLDPVGDELEQHSEYLHRCRRVRVGPAITVVFENARTLRLRLRELARFARATDPARVHREIGWYESLLPGPGRLLASVTVRAPHRHIVGQLENGFVELRTGDVSIRGRVRTDSGGDRIVGLVRWVEFDIGDEHQAMLRDCNQECTLHIEVGGEDSVSAPLSPAIRASLLGDVKPATRINRIAEYSK